MLFVFSRLCVNGSLGHDAVFDAVHVIRQPLNILQGLKGVRSQRGQTLFSVFTMISASESSTDVLTPFALAYLDSAIFGERLGTSPPVFACQTGG